MRISSTAFSFLPRLVSGVALTMLFVAPGCSGDDAVNSSGSGGTSSNATTTGDGGGAAGGGQGGDGGDGGSGGQQLTTDANCEAPSGSQGKLTLTEFASGLGVPVFATHAGDDRLFVVSQTGEIRVVQPDGSSSLFLDVDAGDRVLTNGERGLLGLAFHPDYTNNGRFFVHYSGSPDGRTVIEEYARDSDDPDLADPSPVQTILEVQQPAANHNGGSIEFSPFDGYLYIGLGDGGGSGDPFDTGQDKNSLLATLLRLDVDGGAPYAIPDGNISDGSPEIYHWGLRNPYRFSFDPCSGDLYIGDVGQNAFEEIDVAAADSGPLNWGWPIMEGFSCYNANNCEMNGLALPALDYAHPGNEGRSVTGGAVYRGSNVAWLRGAYIYADFVSSEIWMTRWNGSDATPAELISDDLYEDGAVSNITAFGQNRLGEIFVVSANGAIYRIDAE